MSPDFTLLFMQLLSALVRIGILLPLLFWVIKKIDNINDPELDEWWRNADARSQAIYLSARMAVVALLLVSVLA